MILNWLMAHPYALAPTLIAISMEIIRGPQDEEVLSISEDVSIPIAGANEVAGAL